MTDFTEKKSVAVDNKSNKSKIIIIITIILLFAALLTLLLLLTNNSDNKNNTSSPSIIVGGDSFESENNSIPLTTPQTSTNNDNTVSNISPNSSSSNKNQTNTSSGNNGKSSSNVNSLIPSTVTPVTSVKPNNSDISPSSSSSKISSTVSTGAPSSSKPSTVTSSSPFPKSTAEYIYRDAVQSDDELNFNSALTGGGVTITGVSKADANGIYVIPETLGGKKVVAVASHAFSDSTIKDTVKKVIFPKNIISVNVYSFYSCYNITDIYFVGSTHIAGDAFAPSAKQNYIITLHSPTNATNRNFTKLSNYALYHDMLYEAWDGGEIS